MASTSEVATAPASSGAASRPARTQAVARGWRVLRTGVAFFTFGVGAIVVAGIVWPLRLRPGGTSARREVAVQRVVGAAFRLFAWWLTSLGLIRVSWIGADRLRDRAPRLVVANHPTLIDVVLLLAQLPQADCIVKTAARRNPFMRSIVTTAGYLANDDGDALVDACAERIARGRSVVLFPEGTRSPRGALRRFQRGAAHIALKSGCPIVPVVITCRSPHAGSPRTSRHSTNDSSVPMRGIHESTRGVQGRDLQAITRPARRGLRAAGRADRAHRAPDRRPGARQPRPRRLCGPPRVAGGPGDRRGRAEGDQDGAGHRRPGLPEAQHGTPLIACVCSSPSWGSAIRCSSTRDCSSSSPASSCWASASSCSRVLRRAGGPGSGGTSAA